VIVIEIVAKNPPQMPLVEVYDLPTVMAEHDEYIENSEPGGGYSKEIHRCQPDSLDGYGETFARTVTEAFSDVACISKRSLEILSIQA
jgi:hypothetical protein